jgi:sporulation protein YlmC with PRC-barrel domain
MARMDRDDLRGTRRDQAGIGPHAAAAADLVPLRQMKDVKIVDGDADVRGWDVCTINGAKVGTVDDLLVDRAHGEVVMLDVDLTGSNRHTLAPIRGVQIDRARRIVLIDSADLNGPADVAALSSRPAVTDVPTSAGVPRTADPALADSPRRLADGVEETVVERRPVVYEEVVVRRKVVDPDSAEPPAAG